ncbi:MAG: excinuclease ATPase subunit [Brevundimonas sp.]|nr:MAG: excinuclease ATPase subunit [Brevundimonas sp.]
MKTGLAVTAVVLSAALLAAPATPTTAAADVVTTHELAAVLERPEYAAQLEGVRFYFGDAPHPGVARRIEADATTSQRSRRLGRSSEESCQWVMLSALLRLKSQAEATGGNAVVNVRSNWDNVEWSSRTQYKCSAGFLMAGVALKGDVVRLR